MYGLKRLISTVAEVTSAKLVADQVRIRVSQTKVQLA